MLVDAIIALIDGDSLVHDMVVTELDQTDEGLFAIRPITLNYPDYDHDVVGMRPPQPMRMRILLPVIEITVQDEPPAGANIQIQPGRLADTGRLLDDDDEGEDSGGQ